MSLNIRNTFTIQKRFKFGWALLQIIGTAMILLSSVESSNITLGLLFFWFATFFPISKKEFISFVICNLIFVVNDILAIKAGFFRFLKPDIFGLPYWEFVMWGFYLIHSHRLFESNIPTPFDKRAIFLAVIFSSSFSLIQNRELLLAVTFIIVLGSLMLFREKEDFLITLYLVALGTMFEVIGLSAELWEYPGAKTDIAFLQFVVMWGGAGLYFRRILSGWIVTKES